MKLNRREAQTIATKYSLHWKEVLYYVQRRNLDLYNETDKMGEYYRNVGSQINQARRTGNDLLGAYYKTKNKFLDDVLFLNETY